MSVIRVNSRYIDYRYCRKRTWKEFSLIWDLGKKSDFHPHPTSKSKQKLFRLQMQWRWHFKWHLLFKLCKVKQRLKIKQKTLYNHVSIQFSIHSNIKGQMVIQRSSTRLILKTLVIPPKHCCRGSGSTICWGKEWIIYNNFFNCKFCR